MFRHLFFAFDHLFALALTAFPNKFQERFRWEMQEAFRLRSKEELARGLPWALLAWWLRSLADLLVAIVLEWAAVLSTDFLESFRFFRARSGASLLHVSTLAVCIGTLIGAMGLLNHLVIQPYGYRDLESLIKFQRVHAGTGGRDYRVSFDELRRWRRMEDVFVGIGSYHGSRESLAHKGEGATTVLQYAVSEEMFDVLGIRPEIGRTFGTKDSLSLDSEPVVLGHRLWQRTYEGDPGVIGQEIRLAGQHRTIVGVMPSGYWPGADVFVPFVLPAENSRNERNVCAWARLRERVSLADAQAAIDASRQDPNLRDPLAAQRASVRLVIPAKNQSQYFAGLVGLPLALTIPALLLGIAVWTGMLRLDSLPLRSRIRLADADVEARVPGSWPILTACASAVVGAGLACGVIEWLATTGAARMHPRSASLDIAWSVLVVGALSGLVAGAWVTHRRLRGGGSSSSKKWTEESGARRAVPAGLLKTITVGTVGLSTCLAVWGGQLLFQTWSATVESPGFDVERVLALQFRPVRDATGVATWWPPLRKRLSTQVASLDDVESSALADSLPFFSPCRLVTVRTLPQAGEGQPASRRAVTPSYFETMGIPIKRGRGFDDSSAGRRVVVISESLAMDLFPTGNAIGREVLWSDPPPALHSNGERWRVIGVVGDIRCDLGLNRRLTPSLYIPHPGTSSNALQMAIRARDDMDDLALQIRREVAILDPEGRAILDVKPLGAQRAFLIGRESLGAVLLAVLASMCLFVTVAHFVAQRRCEGPLDTIAISKRWMARIGTAWAVGAALALLGLVVLGSQTSLGLDPLTRGIIRRYYGAATIHAGAALAAALLPMLVFAVAIFRWPRGAGLLSLVDSSRLK